MFFARKAVGIAKNRSRLQIKVFLFRSVVSPSGDQIHPETKKIPEAGSGWINQFRRDQLSAVSAASGWKYFTTKEILMPIMRRKPTNMR